MWGILSLSLWWFPKMENAMHWLFAVIMIFSAMEAG